MSSPNVILEILQEKRVLILVALVALCLGWVFLNGGPFGGGLKFGIDFSGGVRIPILLERPVDPVTLSDMVNTIKTRAAAFGLTEVRVRSVGDSEIYVEVPKTNPTLARDIQELLSKQGVFEAIVDGQVSLAGEHLYPYSIQRMPAQYLSGADWGVGFTITPAGKQSFGTAVKGKANFPLYMFVDRPTDAIVVVSRADLMANANESVSGLILTDSDALAMAADALRLRGHEVPVYLAEELAASGANLSISPATNRTRAILSSAADASLKGRLEARGFNLSLSEPADMRPAYSLSASSASSKGWISKWEAVGLKSAPILQPSVTTGAAGSFYTITGAAEGVGQARLSSADRNAREMIAVLKGGALPVQISIGSVEDVPAPLGQEFLRLSMMGAVFALLCISAMVALRYRTPKVVLPIIFISLSEIIILATILGAFSIDLAGMAGIIAAIGVSVDAQIVVTDEVLKKGAGSSQEKLKHAFSIIVTNAVVATVAMLPLLLLSGLVEIIGFATSTILGYLLGVVLTRPAYGVIVQHLFEKGAAAEGHSGSASS